MPLKCFRACGGQNHNVLSFMLVCGASLDKQKTVNVARCQCRRDFFKGNLLLISPSGSGISGNKHVSQKFQHDFIFVIDEQRMIQLD